MSDGLETASVQRPPWWKSIGPALITACVVFGPGSLLISSKVGANYGYELLWLLLVTGLLMGTFLTMGARIGVCGGATPCTLISERLGRPMAALIGITLCLICAAFQFSNNLAVALAAGAFFSKEVVPWIIIGFNAAVIAFLFGARHIYSLVERIMKVMVGVIIVCFVFNLLVAKPNLLDVLVGFLPSIPDNIHVGLPTKADGGAISDPMILVASLLGTTFSVAGAFFQGNLVRERNWKIEDYENSVGDAIAGVCVLTGVSLIIMITAGTVILGKPADNIATLALSLKPLLGDTAYWVFCIGLIAVAMNPFLINAMIGGTILADGIGLPARMGDIWPRVLTVIVMMVGMIVALLAMRSGQKPINLIIFGQALTVLGNPLMAIAMLWLANRKDVMGERRNGWILNTLGGIGLVVVVLMAIRVVWRIALQFS